MSGAICFLMYALVSIDHIYIAILYGPLDLFIHTHTNIHQKLNITVVIPQCFTACHIYIYETVRYNLSPAEEEVVIWMIANYGLGNTVSVCNTIFTFPPTLAPDQRRRDLEAQLPGNMDAAIDVIMSNTMSSICKAMFRKKDSSAVITPPTGTCIRCRRDLVSSHVTRVNIYSTAGVKEARKYTLRCRQCTLMYRY